MVRNEQGESREKMKRKAVLSMLQNDSFKYSFLSLLRSIGINSSFNDSGKLAMTLRSNLERRNTSHSTENPFDGYAQQHY
jgi:hypothetical protein